MNTLELARNLIGPTAIPIFAGEIVASHLGKLAFIQNAAGIYCGYFQSVSHYKISTFITLEKDSTEAKWSGDPKTTIYILPN